MGEYLPGSECSVCKGKCCRERGCILSPEDLFKKCSIETKEKLLAFLQDDNCMYAIDMANAENGIFYYLRMRTKCYTFIGLEGFGECIALSDKGCILNYDDRPKGGRSLKSSPDFHCHQEYLIEEMYADWKPYQDMLSDIWNEYANLLDNNGTMEKCDRAYYEYLKARKSSRS